MSSRKTTTPRPRAAKGAVADKAPIDMPSPTTASQAKGATRGRAGRLPAPLIPERLAYVYDQALMKEHYNKLLKISKAHRMKFEPVTDERGYQTANLVTLICRLCEKRHGADECEDAMKACLPIREHHVALLTHTMFVTMVGTIVARALEQASVGVTDSPWSDLLADRYYVRDLLIHHSSKTSDIESTAYSGIMAYFMEKEAIEAQAKKGGLKYDHHAHIDGKTVLTAMANQGFYHHYTRNPHHPEHKGSAEMNEPAVIEAVVDGLACILERGNEEELNTALDWIGKYKTIRFPHESNSTFAGCVLNALKQYITDIDFKLLMNFRRAVHALTGTYVAWGRVEMDRAIPLCCPDMKSLTRGLGKLAV
ncbi:CD58 antigen [Sarotherodon galilaeus]